ncbi:16S rRNA (guanine(527)-N(7))-methyltransferase RsmG [Ruminococcaceae bacterium OttesenSCG-928-I18]|nr:16S rRNA (guanine(527)-N(7))-methyltransferase RsmG [Ruminococcaceae bacterium OttesenSCG-928-I18]
MIYKIRLKEKAERYGMKLCPEVLGRCERYAELVDEWNRKINITAITEPEEVEDKHFLDCFLLACQPEIKGKVADVGSGAGFPGIILKIYKPDIEITLIESNKKKTAFLSLVGKELDLSLQVLGERAEDLGRSSARESFDVVTARAVAALPALSEYCLPLVKTGGFFLPMKGPKETEGTEAKKAIEVLGGEIKEIRKYTLPDDSERTIWVVQKSASTPERYPRKMAQIKKKPL